MSEPQRETAAAALVTALSDMSGERRGGWEYAQTPKVSRKQVLSLPPDPDAYPFFVVFAGEHSKLVPHGNPGLNSLGRPGFPYQDHYNLDILGAVTDTSDAVADTWRNRLRDDVLDVLHADVTLGGVVDSIVFAATSDRRESVGFTHFADIGSNRAIFILPITVLLKPVFYVTKN